MSLSDSKQRAINQVT